MPRAAAEDTATEVVTEDAAAAVEVDLAPAAELEEAPQLHKTKAVVIVGNHRFPSDRSDTLVIVTEERKITMSDDGEAVKDVQLKTSGYPSGADLYYRTDAAVEFPHNAQVLTLGVDVQQGMLWGFSPDVAWVHVGPASPAYAAANLAWQRGATEIEIIGLDDREKAQLQAFIDRLPTDTVAPSSAKVTLA